MVIWITGLSGAGKTTLAKDLISALRSDISNIVLLDGDQIRELYGNDLSFHESDRIKQIQRIQKLALFLEKQGLLVIVSALYANDELLLENRATFDDYYEVYLSANVDFLVTREIKGLYKKALQNITKNVVGVDIPWHSPKNPDLTFNVADNISAKKMAEKIIEITGLKNG